MKPTQVQLTPATKEEILQNKTREYNPREWDKTVNRFDNYKDCKYFIIPADKVFAYDRFYAWYKLPEGFSILTQFSYGASLSNAGFSQVTIDETGLVTKTLFVDGSGKYGYAENTPANRRLFALHGLTVTTCI